MKREEKERLANLTMIDSVIVIIFLITISYLVRGFNQINPSSSINLDLILGQVLLYTGLIGCFFGFIKKKPIVMRYSLESVIWGAVLLLLYYSFYKQKIMPNFGNFGFVYYYALLLLGVLYIIISIVYTAIKVKK